MRWWDRNRAALWVLSSGRSIVPLHTCGLNAVSRVTGRSWAQRLRDHVHDPTKLPILIFPEGTCINNTSVMMFKKGSFEVGGVVYPVAIKYDPRFANCFWNSSKYGLLSYIFMMMTSWAMVVDVWYLPAERKRENEDAIAFASRVKRRIAERGGLVDLEWDGGLKRSRPKEKSHAPPAAELQSLCLRIG